MQVYASTLDVPPSFLPLYVSAISAGFPSPAEDYIEGPLDLNQHLIRTPAATFFVRVTGDSMVGLGIQSGDLLIVDRSLSISNGRVIIAAINGDLTVKQLSHRNGGTYLLAANEKYPPKAITEDTAFEVWGVVTHVIHKV